jgi:outer membrane autotransporter protein
LVDSLRGLVAEELSSQRRGFRMIANGQLGNISRRLEAVRFGQGSGISLAGLTIADQALPLDMLGTGGDGVGAEGSDDGLLGRGLGLFLTGVVGRGERDASDLESGFQTDSHSLLLGVDQRFGSQWVAGAALSASRFDSDLDDAAGTLDMDLESVLVYASYSLGQGWIDGSLGVGRGDLEQLRNVSFETTTDEGSVSSTDVLRARSDVDLTSASLSAGYDFQRGGWRFGPRLALEYANLELDGYTEQAVQGSDSFAVQIDRQELRSLLVRAGLGLSGVISTSRAVLVPQFEIQYVSQLEDDVVPLRGRFVNDPMAQPFLLPTSAVDDSNGEFSLGLSAIFPNGRSAYFSYRRQFAATGIEQYFISAGARFEF